MSTHPLFRFAALITLIGWVSSGPAAGNDPPVVPVLAVGGEQSLSLNGTWDFTTDPTAVDNKDAKWDSLTVPGNWDVQPAYSTYAGKGWYRRTFTVPDTWKGLHVRLCFDAVYQGPRFP